MIIPLAKLRADHILSHSVVQLCAYANADVLITANLLPCVRDSKRISAEQSDSERWNLPVQSVSSKQPSVYGPMMYGGMKPKITNRTDQTWMVKERSESTESVCQWNCWGFCHQQNHTFDIIFFIPFIGWWIVTMVKYNDVLERRNFQQHKNLTCHRTPLSRFSTNGFLMNDDGRNISTFESSNVFSWFITSSWLFDKKTFFQWVGRIFSLELLLWQ